MNRADRSALLRPVLYFQLNGTVSGNQPEGCSPNLYGIDLTTDLGKHVYAMVLAAKLNGDVLYVGGTGVLVMDGLDQYATVLHPSENILYVQIGDAS